MDGWRTVPAQWRSVPDLFAALQEQLGLKLVRRQPIEILIVDPAERVPTEN